MYFKFLQRRRAKNLPPGRARGFVQRFPNIHTEISTLDLLALSQLSYWEPTSDPIGMRVQDLIANKWNEYWNDDWKAANILNRDLFANLADWKVYAYTSDKKTGFAAYAFYNDSNDFVIAYRGSTELSLGSLLFDPDWLKNDIWMIIGGEGAQVSQALDFYKPVVGKSDNIFVTGHSLGGGLADIVAARYGCKGESFNSAPFLDIAYGYYPDLMSEVFDGTDVFTFMSHANKADWKVGNYPAEQFKPLWLYEGNGVVSSAHSLASFVTKDTDGSVKMLKSYYKRSGNIVSQNLQLLLGVFSDEVTLGTSKNDKLLGVNPASAHIVLGGEGVDDIITNIRSDTISGGKGNDIIDGSWGGDTYIYYKGHGVDKIHDTSGNDEILLRGFTASDTIRVEEGDDTYAYITVNGSTIIKIAKRRSNPVTGWNNSFAVSSNQGFNQNIESYLKDKRDFFERLLFSCPVNVEIVNDATGEVVYTLYDQTEETAYTEYGNFYVFEQEDGEYTKIADLIEGYSVRIVGISDGKMDAVVLDTDGFNLSKPYTAQDVPVTKGMVATVEGTADGEKNLAIDTDADGHPDVTVALTVNETDSEEPPSGGMGTPNTSGSSGSSGNPNYQITVPSTSNGTVTVTPKSATSGTKVTITATPNDGYTIGSVTVTDRSGNSISVTDNGDGTYTFTMPASQVNVSATFVAMETQISWINPFADVAESDWFYDEVAYVVQNGLMNGVGNGQFNPSGTTTRGMIMTILARLAGVDTSGSNPWYQMGMEWAVREGVSDGTGPETDITREQLATMLWRYAGEPAATGDLSAFPDASKVHDWASNAMIWAVQNGIINGSDGKLNPQGNALRSEAAAMLTRFCKNIER